MPTERQIAANRRNAQKSTGPRSAQGKARSRLNALKNGLRSKAVVLEGPEDPTEFRRFRQGFRDDFHPVGPAEIDLVDQIALAAWRRNRAIALETSVWNQRIAELPPDTPPDEKLPRAFAHPATMRTLDALSLHQTRLNQIFFRGIQELHRLRCLPANPNEPSVLSSSF